jgi:hypothetical protein
MVFFRFLTFSYGFLRFLTVSWWSYGFVRRLIVYGPACEHHKGGTKVDMGPAGSDPRLFSGACESRTRWSTKGLDHKVQTRVPDIA